MLFNPANLRKPITKVVSYDDTEDSLSEFAEERKKRLESPDTDKPDSISYDKKNRSYSSPYSSFLRKYENLESHIDTFGTRDLVYYFREIAQESGFKYTISNIKKDMAIMKRLRESYTNKEICGMIEFLYESEQDYLSKPHLSINILGSSWINTIYADTLLWIDDKFIPRGKETSSKRKKSQHEWDSGVASDDTIIGVKL